jgi:hypothetical protein
MSQSTNGGGIWVFIIGGAVLCSLIGSCNKDNSSTHTSSDLPKNDYQDMRNRGHSEEDAVIFSILKQQGYSDYDALNATKSSK